MRNEKQILDALPGTLYAVAARTSLSVMVVHEVLAQLLRDSVVNVRMEPRMSPYTALVYYVPERSACNDR